MEGFEYVVNPPEIPKVAFGSGLPREVLPMQGPMMTPYQRRHQPEYREFLGPAEHHVESHLGREYPSKLGFSAFSSKLPRLPHPIISKFPPIGTYNWDIKVPLKKSAKPFGVGTKREYLESFLTPGPSTYSHHVPRPKPKICTAFGSMRKEVPAVAVFCSPYNISKCMTCGETPLGDYWHNFNKNLDLCRICMTKELEKLKHCDTDVTHRIVRHRELRNFLPARYCGFFHDHNGTVAAIQIMPSSTLHYKIKKENYLHLYLKMY